MVDGVHYYQGTYTSEHGTSGGPVMMGDRVVGVNCKFQGGSTLFLSLFSVHWALMEWCNFDVRDSDFISFVCTTWSI